VLHAIVRSKDPTMCDNDTIRTTINYKWNASEMYTFHSNFIIYWADLACLLLTINWFPINEDEPFSISARVSSSVFGCILVITFLGEVQQWIALGSQYVAFWNFVQLCHFFTGATVVLGVLFSLLSRSTMQLVLAWTIFLKVYGLMYYLQGIRYTGRFVKMFFSTLLDLINFAIIMAIAMAASTAAFYVLFLKDRTSDSESDGQYTSISNAIFSAFNLLVLVDFESDEFVSGDVEYLVSLRIMFVFSMVLVPLVLLNLLIAIMGNTYTKIDERAECEFLFLRARLIVESEIVEAYGKVSQNPLVKLLWCFAEILEKLVCFSYRSILLEEAWPTAPTWIHVLKRSDMDMESDDEGSSEWSQDQVKALLEKMDDIKLYLKRQSALLRKT